MAITYGAHVIDEGDVSAVIDALQSDFLTQGPLVQRFEEAISKKIGVEHCLVCSSGTSALHLACLAIGLGSNDLVWVTSISFVASANAALYCGSRIEFVDIDLDTYNIDLKGLCNRLEQAAEHDALPRAIIITSMCGNPVHLVELAGLARRYNVKIIEDACHALGAKRDQVYVGADGCADITAFSFHPLKMITTGEGGAIVTKSRDLFDRAKLLRSHGIVKRKYDPEDPFAHLNYSQADLGYNYRLPDILCALGLSQLNKLDMRVERRNEIAKYYSERLSPELKTQSVKNSHLSSYHIYVVLVPEDRRPSVIRRLIDSHIEPSFHYKPIFLHDYYANNSTQGYSDMRNSLRYFDTALTIPLHNRMTDAEVEYVVSTVNRATN